MPVDVVIPDLGESITEALIASWLRSDGEQVAADEPIAELETDKATVELPAPGAGTLNILIAAGSTVAVGDTIARIEAATAGGPKPVAVTPAALKTTQASTASKAPESIATQATMPAESAETILSPAARRLVEEHGLTTDVIAATGRGGRITKGDVLAHLDNLVDPTQAPSSGTTATPAGAAADAVARPSTAATAATTSPSDSPRATLSPGLALIRSGKSNVAMRSAVDSASHDRPDEERVAMTPLRRTIAARLLNAQATAAILTTFNEIDMSAVMELRTRYKQAFTDAHGVSLGFMSFFARACVLACSDVPSVNARLEGDEIVYNNRVHLGIAASTPKGLVVPVVKGADAMSLADLEREIARLGGLARESKLSIPDMEGGTFTISNGGVFGSLMSTPILNPPQSGILGMHKIEKRAVVIDDEIVIRPMMYVALSYDHRLVDGREAVTFLVRIKERIEDPERMLLGV